MQREQFGRPLSNFQAIQHLLSEIGAEAAAADATVDNAVMQVRRGSAMDASPTAAATYRAGPAAGVVPARPPQLQGPTGSNVRPTRRARAGQTESVSVGHAPLK